jgi:rhodanese-related sulfurtransferase
MVIIAFQMKENYNLNISQTELQQIINCKNVCLVDVREEIEFDEFNIGGINIPGHLISERLAALEKFDFLIIACSNGTISHILTRVFKKKLPQKTILHLKDGIY